MFLFYLVLIYVFCYDVYLLINIRRKPDFRKPTRGEYVAIWLSLILVTISMVLGLFL